MFKVLDEVCEPKRATKYSAYVDLYAREDVVIGAGETKVIKLGVKLDLENLKNIAMKESNIYYRYSDDEVNEITNDFLKSHYLEVALRSSLAVKGLIIANGTGKVDLDYPDEIGLIVHYPFNNKFDEVTMENGTGAYRVSKKFIINKGDKVAQATLIKHKGYLMGYESDVIREGGFGSTGR